MRVFSALPVNSAICCNSEFGASALSINEQKPITEPMTRVSRFLLAAATLSAPVPLHAADTSEFTRLQSSYKVAIERATKPLTQNYLVELEKLRDVYARAAKLEAANVVQAEINAIKQEIAAAELAKRLPAAAQPQTPAAASDPAIKAAPGATGRVLALHWFVGKSWQTDKKTKWSFKKDGTGEMVRGNLKLGIFTWRVLDTGLVELSERPAPDKPANVQYIQFKDRSEAWKGPSVDQLALRLYVE